MDADRFDRLSKTVFHAGTRRQLLGLLTTVPVLGALTALLGPEETEAEQPANRLLQHKEQRRRKARQERRKTRHQKQDQNQNNNNGGGGSGGGGGDAPGALGGGACVPPDQGC